MERGDAQRHCERLIKPLKWELADSFEFIGSPTEGELRQNASPR
ncbi:MAG: hypothetical protein ACE5OS_01020 [Anaerolineae bacterium]